jgi:hypothetical protein
MLSRTLQRRVSMLISKFMDLHAGIKHSFRVHDQTGSPEHPLCRFMFNGIVQHFHACYIASGNGAQDVLRRIGFGSQADEIDKRLSLPVGGHTLRTYIDEHRNTLLAHPSFDPLPFWKRVVRKADLHDASVKEQFGFGLYELTVLTQFVHGELRKAYPIAASWDDERWTPVDNPPATND